MDGYFFVRSVTRYIKGGLLYRGVMYVQLWLSQLLLAFWSVWEGFTIPATTRFGFVRLVMGCMELRCL